MKCLQCKFETSNPRFCSKSCAAKYNNSKSPKRNQEGSCKKCGEVISSSRSYCSICWDENGNNVKSIVKLNRWLSGDWSGGNNLGLSNIIRDYLLKESDYCCSKCGFNTPHPDDHRTILEINHINGNGTDHRRENLEVLCPNCHALTSTYRGRNIGNGRPVSYIRKST